MRVRCIVAVAVWLLPTPPARAQVPPSRDRVATAAVGTGSIKGRVIDAQSGAGLPRAHVRLHGPNLPQGQTAVTDQAGAFAFRRVPAGPFFLTVDKATFLTARYPETGSTFRSGRPATLGAGEAIDGLTIAIYHGAAIVGRILDVFGDPLENVQLQAFRVPKGGRGPLQARFGGGSNDLGEFRIARLEPGDYVVLARPQGDMFRSPSNQADDSEPRPIPTFYPGVADLGAAQPIHVERGSTINADFAVASGMLARVTGMLVDRAGQAVTRGGTINIRPIVKGAQFGGFSMSGSASRPDGTFELRLAPGEYVLEGRSMPIGGASENDFGSVRLTVAADVSNVVIQLGPGGTVSGRVIFEGGGQIPSAEGQAVPLFLSSDDGSSCQRGRAELAPDWTFTIVGVSGTCSPRLSGVQRWMPKAVLYEGRDVSDAAMTLAAGHHVRGLEVVMTDKRAHLTVHVVDDRGAPTRDYVALLFPLDRNKWTEDGRNVRTLVTSSDPPRGLTAASTPGASATVPPRKDVLGGVLPGDYYVVAVNDLETDGPRQREVLERLARGAVRLTLAEGNMNEITLRMAVLAAAPR